MEVRSDSRGLHTLDMCKLLIDELIVSPTNPWRVRPSAFIVLQVSCLVRTIACLALKDLIESKSGDILQYNRCLSILRKK